jgi:hypothetical protein
MPAGLPGATKAQNLANPTQGPMVIFNPLSGPKGSPFDLGSSGTVSTGALSTGIGFGSPPIIGPTAPGSIRRAGFNDDYTLGVTKPDGTASANSVLVFIGGGRMIKNNGATVSDRGRPFIPAPYTTGFALGAAGNGGSRDAGAGPIFTSFALKMVTAAGAVAGGAVIETGFTNRSGLALVTGQSTFGSATAATVAPTLEEMPDNLPPPPPPPLQPQPLTEQAPQYQAPSYPQEAPAGTYQPYTQL